MKNAGDDARAGSERADFWMQDKCVVCQTRHFSDTAKQKHVASSSHQKKVVVFDFFSRESSSFTASAAPSMILDRYAREHVAVLGLECVHEFVFPAITERLWACSLCYMAGGDVESLDEHLSSVAHRITYIEEYHPHRKPKSRQIRELTVELDRLSAEIVERECNGRLQQPEVLHFTRASREWTARLLAIDIARADCAFQLVPLKPDLSLVHCQICHEAMPTAAASVARVWANHTAKVAHKKCVVINDLIEKVTQSHSPSTIPTALFDGVDDDTTKQRDPNLLLGAVVGADELLFFGRPVQENESPKTVNLWGQSRAALRPVSIAKTAWSKDACVFCRLCHCLLPATDAYCHARCEHHFMQYLKKYYAGEVFAVAQFTGDRRRYEMLKIAAKSEEKNGHPDSASVACLPSMVAISPPAELRAAAMTPLWNEPSTMPAVVVGEGGQSNLWCQTCWKSVPVRSVVRADVTPADVWNRHVATNHHLECMMKRALIHFDDDSFVDGAWRPFPSSTTAVQAQWTTQKFGDDVNQRITHVQNVCDVGLEWIVVDAERDEHVCTLCAVAFPVSDRTAITVHVREENHLVQYLRSTNATLINEMLDQREQRDLRSSLLLHLVTWWAEQGECESTMRVHDARLAESVRKWGDIPLNRVLKLAANDNVEMKAKYQCIMDLMKTPGNGEEPAISIREALSITGIQLHSIDAADHVATFWCTMCRHVFCVEDARSSAAIVDGVWSTHLRDAEHRRRRAAFAANAFETKRFMNACSTFTVHTPKLVTLNDKCVAWRVGGRCYEFVLRVIGLDAVVECRREDASGSRLESRFFCRLCAEQFPGQQAALESHVRGVPHLVNYLHRYQPRAIRELQQLESGGKSGGVQLGEAEQSRALRQRLTELLADEPPRARMRVYRMPPEEEERAMDKKKKGGEKATSSNAANATMKGKTDSGKQDANKALGGTTSKKSATTTKTGTLKAKLPTHKVTDPVSARKLPVPRTAEPSKGRRKTKELELNERLEKVKREQEEVEKQLVMQQLLAIEREKFEQLQQVIVKQPSPPFQSANPVVAGVDNRFAPPNYGNQLAQSVAMIRQPPPASTMPSSQLSAGPAFASGSMRFAAPQANFDHNLSFANRDNVATFASRPPPMNADVTTTRCNFHAPPSSDMSPSVISHNSLGQFPDRAMRRPASNSPVDDRYVRESHEMTDDPYDLRLPDDVDGRRQREQRLQNQRYCFVLNGDEREQRQGVEDDERRARKERLIDELLAGGVADIPWQETSAIEWNRRILDAADEQRTIGVACVYQVLETCGRWGETLLCAVCRVWHVPEMMREHVQSRKHRIAYLKERYSEMYYRAMASENGASVDAVREAFRRSFDHVWHTEGSGSMTKRTRRRVDVTVLNEVFGEVGRDATRSPEMNRDGSGPVQGGWGHFQGYGGFASRVMNQDNRPVLNHGRGGAGVERMRNAMDGDYGDRTAEPEREFDDESRCRSIDEMRRRPDDRDYHELRGQPNWPRPIEHRSYHQNAASSPFSTSASLSWRGGNGEMPSGSFNLQRPLHFPETTDYERERYSSSRVSGLAHDGYQQQPLPDMELESDRASSDSENGDNRSIDADRDYVAPVWPGVNETEMWSRQGQSSSAFRPAIMKTDAMLASYPNARTAQTAGSGGAQLTRMQTVVARDHELRGRLKRPSRFDEMDMQAVMTIINVGDVASGQTKKMATITADKGKITARKGDETRMERDDRVVPSILARRRDASPPRRRQSRRDRGGERRRERSRRSRTPRQHQATTSDDDPDRHGQQVPSHHVGDHLPSKYTQSQMQQAASNAEQMPIGQSNFSILQQSPVVGTAVNHANQAQFATPDYRIPSQEMMTRLPASYSQFRPEQAAGLTNAYDFASGQHQQQLPATTRRSSEMQNVLQQIPADLRSQLTSLIDAASSNAIVGGGLTEEMLLHMLRDERDKQCRQENEKHATLMRVRGDIEKKASAHTTTAPPANYGNQQIAVNTSPSVISWDSLRHIVEQVREWPRTEHRPGGFVQVANGNLPPGNLQSSQTDYHNALMAGGNASKLAGYAGEASLGEQRRTSTAGIWMKPLGSTGDAMSSGNFARGYPPNQQQYAGGGTSSFADSAQSNYGQSMPAPSEGNRRLPAGGWR